MIIWFSFWELLFEISALENVFSCAKTLHLTMYQGILTMQYFVTVRC